MRGQPSLLVPALAALTCAILAGCTAGRTSGAARHTLSSSARPAASSPRATWRIGSPGNPLLLTCAAEVFPGYPDPPVPRQPQPGDLVIGPLFITNGKVLATESPAQYGYASYGHGGRFYKIPFVLLPGSAATVTIAAPARGHAVIAISGRGVTAASYHSCPRATGFFAQGFAFTAPPFRGCLPLEVRIGHQPQARHVTLSLFAGLCPS
jgi:hypothetical protein